jgi:hypothetical protein
MAKATWSGFMYTSARLCSLSNLMSTHLGRAQRTLDEELFVGREVDHVDVLVAQFTHDAMDACFPSSPHKRSDRIDAVVVALHRHLGALTGFAHDAFDGDEAIGHFGHLLLEQLGSGIPERCG